MSRTSDARDLVFGLAVPVLALLSFGAVLPAERFAVHGLLGLLLAWRAGRGDLPDGAWRVLVAGLWIAAGLVLGLVPVPAEVLKWLSPGLAAARPHDAWWTLALRPDRVIDDLTLWSVVAGQAVLVASLSPDPRTWRRVMAWGVVGLAAIDIGHAASGARSLFGLVPLEAPITRFHAPLVNPNHTGALLVAGLPIVVAEARSRGRDVGAVVLWLTAAWTVVYPVVAASMGVGVALAGVAAATIVRQPWSVGRRAAALVALGTGAVLGAWGVTTSQPEWWWLSGRPRVGQWTDTLVMWWDHRFVGVGAGNYEAAFPPYRTVPGFGAYPHAHSDLLEQLATTGLVGVATWMGAAWAWPRRRHAALWPFWLGLWALVLHGLVDFPWRTPGVALVGATLLGICTRVGSEAPRPARPGMVLLAAAVFAGLFHQAHLRTLEADIAALRDGRNPPGARARVEAAGWSDAAVMAELQDGYRSELAEAGGRRFLHDGLALARLGHQALKAEDVETAGPLLERAVVREPNDYRSWQLVAIHREQVGDERGAAAAWAEAFEDWPRASFTDDTALRRAYARTPDPDFWVRALAEAPAHWSVRLAWLLDRQGEHAAALRACEQAGRLRPVVHRWLASCAAAHEGLGDLGAARAYLDAWLAEDPEAFWGWVAKADQLDRIGAGPDDAAAMAEARLRAAALRPTDKRVRAWVEPAGPCDGDPTAPVTAWCLYARITQPGPCDGAVEALRTGPWWSDAWVAEVACTR